MEKTRVGRRIARRAVDEVLGPAYRRRRFGGFVPWMAATAAAAAIVFLALNPAVIERALGVPIVETAVRVLEPLRDGVASLFDGGTGP